MMREWTIATASSTPSRTASPKPVSVTRSVASELMA